jgi:hypothetical protein
MNEIKCSPLAKQDLQAIKAHLAMDLKKDCLY